MIAQCIACSDCAVQRHHVVYAQALRAHARSREVADAAGIGDRRPRRSLSTLMADERNLVAVCKKCHERHHSRFVPLSASALPDSVFEFAVELMGNGAAFEYLRRRYLGPDPRLDVLLGEQAA